MLEVRREQAGRRTSAGEDRAYDTADHLPALREREITPHVAQNNPPTRTGKCRPGAIDAHTTRYLGHVMSQSRPATIACIFGWGKRHATMRKTRQRGLARAAGDFHAI